MSAFKVYGVSFSKILAKVRDQTDVEDMTIAEFEAKCVDVAKDKFKRAKPTAISSAFDAPQFCNDFIALCDRKNFARLGIRPYQDTGKVMTRGKRKGLPKFAWRPHDPFPKYWQGNHGA